MKLRLLGLLFVLVISFNHQTFAHEAEVSPQEYQKYLDTMQYEVDSRLKQAEDLLARHVDQIELNVAAAVALELLYSVAQKTGSIAPESKWYYGVRALQIWTALSSLEKLWFVFTGDLKDVVMYSGMNREIKNQRESFKQAQGLVGSMADFDVDSHEFTVA